MTYKYRANRSALCSFKADILSSQRTFAVKVTLRNSGIPNLH